MSVDISSEIAIYLIVRLFAAVQEKYDGYCLDKNTVYFASLLSNPCRDSLKHPTTVKAINVELS